MTKVIDYKNAYLKEAQRLDWVMRYSPQLDMGYLLVYLTSSISPDGRSGHFTATGKDYRECIDMAIQGILMRVD